MNKASSDPVNSLRAVAILALFSVSILSGGLYVFVPCIGNRPRVRKQSSFVDARPALERTRSWS